MFPDFPALKDFLSFWETTLDGPLFAVIPPERMLGLEARLDRALPAGNEGAGIVVDAGSDVRALVGRTVTARSPLGMYAQYLCVPKTLNPSIMVMKSAKDGA
jgi:hypothetical protein